MKKERGRNPQTEDGVSDLCCHSLAPSNLVIKLYLAYRQLLNIEQMPWPMKSLKSVGARKVPLGICVQLWVVKEGRVDGLGVVASFSIYTIK